MNNLALLNMPSWNCYTQYRGQTKELKEKKVVEWSRKDKKN
jgi:hypothetical protein